MNVNKIIEKAKNSLKEKLGIKESSIPIDEKTKMYIIVRDGLSYGQQAAQAVHAARALQELYPVEERKWHELSNTVVILQVRDAVSLVSVQQTLHGLGEVHAFFEDEAFSFKLTAVACIPKNQQMFANFEPAFR